MRGDKREEDRIVKYEKIVEWDNGYLVVLAKYHHNEELKIAFVEKLFRES